jgi:hypothetical protein
VKHTSGSGDGDPHLQSSSRASGKKVIERPPKSQSNSLDSLLPDVAMTRGLLFDGEPRCPICGRVGPFSVRYSSFVLDLWGDGSADVGYFTPPKLRCEAGCDLSATSEAAEIESALEEQFLHYALINFERWTLRGYRAGQHMAKLAYRSAARRRKGNHLDHITAPPSASRAGQKR